jgi:nucleoside triphosphate pyrophosphatase
MTAKPSLNHTARPIVLASASRARRELLAAAGIPFTVEAADVDEPAIRRALKPNTTPTEVAAVLARAKAEDVGARHGDALVIGADQVLAFGDEILTKPGDVDGARKSLLKLRGKTHELHSSVAFAEGGDIVWTHTGTARLTMRDFSDDFLDEYLVRAGDSVLQSVGAYELEGAGVQLFDRVEGDYFTVLGLPLLAVLGELRARGVIAA